MSYTKWTPELDAKVIELYTRKTNSELAKLLKTTKGAIKARAFKLRLLKDPKFWHASFSDGRFKPGQTPMNKGKKWSEYMPLESQKKSRMTQFKKGNMPPNHKPVGSTRKESKDGYILEKVAEPNKWELKHRLVWKEHNGEIPKGYNVQFKDGNRLNCNISNLYLISRKKQMEHNSIVRYPNEIRTALMRVSKINRMIKNTDK